MGQFTGHAPFKEAQALGCCANSNVLARLHDEPETAARGQRYRTQVASLAGSLGSAGRFGHDRLVIDAADAAADPADVGSVDMQGDSGLGAVVADTVDVAGRG